MLEQFFILFYFCFNLAALPSISLCLLGLWCPYFRFFLKKTDNTRIHLWRAMYMLIYESHHFFFIDGKSQPQVRNWDKDIVWNLVFQHQVVLQPQNYFLHVAWWDEVGYVIPLHSQLSSWQILEGHNQAGRGRRNFPKLRLICYSHGLFLRSLP